MIDAELEAPSHSGRKFNLLLTAIAAVAVMLALYIGGQVVGVLYGIVLPPTPPLPHGSRLISHESTAYGVDYWRYHNPTDACEVLAFYQTNGGRCVVAPMQCASQTATTYTIPDELVARCYGEVWFSVFAMQWMTIISRTQDADLLSRIDLEREVFWIGGPRPEDIAAASIPATPIPDSAP
ncbi:MAG: hypothetical protein SNJ59_01400 [Aggregatilineales bacterium]